MKLLKYLPVFAFAAFIGQTPAFSFGASEDAVAIAPPALDLPSDSGNLQTAVFAGGVSGVSKGCSSTFRG